jgi:hypothetical protein
MTAYVSTSEAQRIEFIINHILYYKNIQNDKYRERIIRKIKKEIESIIRLLNYEQQQTHVVIGRLAKLLINHYSKQQNRDKYNANSLINNIVYSPDGCQLYSTTDYGIIVLIYYLPRKLKKELYIESEIGSL